MEAGWGRAEFSVATPVPLAGYATWRERVSDRVRDPLFCRAIALRDGGLPVVLVAYDLLLVSDALSVAVRARLADTGARVVVHATHTHSSMGGFWDSFLCRRFMGQPRAWALPRLVDAGERAARQAIASLAPAEPRSASVLVPGLNGNRRDPAGPRDEELTVLRLVRESDEAIVASYPAHPVIVAERDFHAVSADFPGEVVARLERDCAFAMYVQGSLGGVDVLFPEDRGVTADRNIELMSAPLANAALHLARGAGPGPASLGFAEVEIALPRPDPRPYFDDQWQRKVDLPLRLLFRSLLGGVPRRARVAGFRVGDFAFVGTPSDLGVSIGLAIKAAARAAGVANPVAASQTDGYIGYLHRRDDYRRAPPPGGPHLGMARYENAMGFFGRDGGERVLDAAREVIGRLQPML